MKYSKIYFLNKSFKILKKYKIKNEQKRKKTYSNEKKPKK
jgi:hypothetical protein